MYFAWCRNLFRLSARRPRTVRNDRRVWLALECLEDRAVPAFLAPASFTVGTNPAGVAVGDFNGDGKEDLAAVNQTSPASISVLMSNGDGTFQPKVDYSVVGYAADATAGDFNGDGHFDLAVVAPGTLSVLLGNGDGSFQAATPFAIGGGASVRAGDFNNDGKLDVASVSTGVASVVLGNGDGTFGARLDAVIPGNTTNLVVGDFNRDGKLDMATSNTFSTGTITLLTGHGDGSFDPAASIYAYSAPVWLASGDFNHDGYDDFAVANSYAATSMSIVMNRGDGSYAAPVTYGIGQTGYEIEVADVNQDGNDDYIVRGGSAYMVGLGKGDGTFFAPVNTPTPSGRFEAGTHGDFNGDGAVDFAYPSTFGVTIVMNANDSFANLAGAVGFQVTTPASTTSGSALPMTVTAVDADGNPATGFLGTIFIASNDPAAKTTTAYTFTAADGGTHTFNGAVRLVAAGDQTVTVSAPRMAPTTNTVTVTPAVSKFVVSAPAASTAGDTFDVTVTALDPLGNVGAGYTSTVHFTSSDGQAGLPADYTFTPGDAGSHTFQVTLKSSGSRFVSVTEVGGSVTGGAFVSVSPAAVSGIQIAGAGGAIGVARPFTIYATDVYGNIATSYAGTVHVTSSDPSAVLPADTTLVNGAATVPVTLLTVGTQTITATDVADPSLTGTTTSDATPPVPALFTVTGYPATTAGVAQSFTVTVRDTIGQVATGYTGTVTFSSSDVQAGLPASYTFTTADGGSHTFTATLRTAGTQSVAVGDAAGLVGSQVGIAVSPAAFTGFRLSVPNPTDSKGHILLTAGDLVALTVRASDVFGNTVTGYKGKVQFSSTDTLASLPANYNFTAADAGAHTFNVALKTATPNGVVWSVNVVDASNAATLATVTNFEVTNAAAAKFVLSTPTNATAGTPFTVTVTVLDAFGNKVKNYFGTVHFSGSAGLATDYQFTSLDGGVASFDVTLNATGNQTISVVDTSNALLTASGVVSVKTASTGGGGGGGGGGTGGGGGKKV